MPECTWVSRVGREIFVSSHMKNPIAWDYVPVLGYINIFCSILQKKGWLRGGAAEG
jgi:hypothetical protein